MWRPPERFRSMRSRVHWAAPHTTSIPSVVYLTDRSDILISDLLGLINLLFSETTPHEQAVKLSTILYIILYLSNTNLGLISCFRGAFAKHIYDSLDNPQTLLMSPNPRTHLFNQEAIWKRYLLPDITTLAINQLYAIKNFRFSAGVADHHKCFFGLFRNEMVRIRRLLQQCR